MQEGLITPLKKRKSFETKLSKYKSLPKLKSVDLPM